MMHVQLVSALRRGAQSIRHLPLLRGMGLVWALLRRPYLSLLGWAGKSSGIEVVVGGCPLRLHPIFATLRWEHFEDASYRAFLDELRPDSVVFDVGAHIGTYSLLAASRVKSPGRVVAFEPHARTREYLSQHRLWNPGGEHVTVRDACCGAASGEADFYCLPDKMEGTNGLVPVAGFERQTIRVSTLDEESKQLGCRPTLIKIDVEGAEWDVLKGASEILSQQRPVVMVSLHPQALAQQHHSSDEVLAWLRARGYDCRVIGQDHEVHVLARPRVES